MTEPRRPLVIDLNADVGEGVTAEQLAVEDAVIRSVTSVNVACGGHAGDVATMRRAVQRAVRRGVAVGAHPGYPDRANFGRSPMDIGSGALRATLTEQIRSLHAVAVSEGVALAHCKAHGALYHAASADESVARVIYEACADVDPGLRLVGQAGSPAVGLWRAWGAVVIEEAFVDRAYEADGSLRSRAAPGAIIDDPGSAAEQASRIVTTQTVRCVDGGFVPIRADTLCLHADTEGAGGVAEEVARSLLEAGVTLRSYRHAM